MLIQDAIAFINGLAKECKAESDKFWEQGCGEQASELMRRQRTFETVKEMLENYSILVTKKESDCLSKAIDCLRECSEQDKINPYAYVEAQAVLNEYKRNHPSLVQIDKSNEYREQGYQEGYLDGVRDGKQIMFNKLQEFVERSDEDV
jgi:hypothetical protein